MLGLSTGELTGGDLRAPAWCFRRDSGERRPKSWWNALLIGRTLCRGEYLSGKVAGWRRCARPITARQWGDPHAVTGLGESMLARTVVTGPLCAS